MTSKRGRSASIKSLYPLLGKESFGDLGETTEFSFTLFRSGLSLLLDRIVMPFSEN
jgi:hypothetical protein